MPIEGINPFSRPVVLILTILIAAMRANAQFDSATLSGVVTDSATAVIRGATARATNEGTSSEFTASTNDEGRYVLTNLRPGSYLQVNQNGRLDVQLEPRNR